MFRWIQTLLLATLLCGPAAAQRKVHIRGSLQGIPQVRQVVLRAYYGGASLSKPATVDSNGSYEIRMKLPTAALMLLTFVADSTVVVQNGVADKVYNIPVFLQHGEIVVETRDSVPNTKILGSEAHNDFRQLEAAREPYERALRYWQARAADLGQRRAAVRRIDSLQALLRDEVYGKFLQHNIASPIAFYALSNYRHLNANPERVLFFLYNLPRKQRHSPLGRDLLDYTRTLAKAPPGSEALDFSLPDTLGKEVALSSFRGRWVLLHFWSSGGFYGRMENAQLREAFRRFGTRNFTLVGVSVERGRSYRKQWRQVIRQDGLTWTQLAEFKYWDSKLLKRYGIESTPQNLLIDPSGTIVDRNLTGSDLFSRLDDLLEP